MAKKQIAEWTPTLQELLASRPRVGMKFGHTLVSGESMLMWVCEVLDDGRWRVQMLPADPLTWEPRGNKVLQTEIDVTTVIVMVAGARKHNRVITEGFGYEAAHA
jgi:hypothetical protein